MLWFLFFFFFSHQWAGHISQRNPSPTKSAVVFITTTESKLGLMPCFFFHDRLTVPTHQPARHCPLLWAWPTQILGFGSTTHVVLGTSGSLWGLCLHLGVPLPSVVSFPVHPYKKQTRHKVSLQNQWPKARPKANWPEFTDSPAHLTNSVFTKNPEKDRHDRVHLWSQNWGEEAGGLQIPVNLDYIQRDLSPHYPQKALMKM